VVFREQLSREDPDGGSRDVRAGPFDGRQVSYLQGPYRLLRATAGNDAPFVNKRIVQMLLAVSWRIA
jgi:hypothetical protein